MSCWIKVVAIPLLLVNASELCVATDFAEVLKSPIAFNAKRVSLRGVADVAGDQFILFENAGAALNNDFEKAIFIRQQRNEPDLEYLRGRWVSVTGLVDAERHGPLGIGFRCELLLDRLALIPGVLVRLRVGVTGRFHNKTGTDIHIRLSDMQGRLYAEFDVPNGGFNGLGIRSGKAVVSTLVGTAVTEGKITIDVDPRLSPTGETPMMFFVVTRHGIDKIPPRNWPKMEHSQ